MSDEIETEEDETTGPRAYPWNPWSPLVALSVLCTGVAESLAAAFKSIYHDIAAAWNWREGQRRFQNKAAKSIETITEEK